MASKKGKDGAWKHFCTVLNLSSPVVLALKEEKVDSPESWYEYGEGWMVEEQQEERMFDFDSKGQIKFLSRQRLKKAWFWLYENKDSRRGGEFCNAFSADSYQDGNEERKRKFLQQHGRGDDDDRERKRPALETKSSRMSASSFTADSKHTLEGVGTVPPHPYEHMIPSHVRELFLELVDKVDPECDRVRTITEFFRDRGDGYKLKSIGGDRSVQKDLLDGLVETGVFNNRVTTERKYNDDLPIADRARTLKDLDLDGGVATSGSPPDGYFHSKLLSSKTLGDRHVLVAGIFECKGSESSVLQGAGEATAIASNAAMALFKIGLPVAEIVIPILSFTGTQVQFAAVYLLEHTFPAVCFLSLPLQLQTESIHVAKYLCAMLDFTVQLEGNVSRKHEAGELVSRKQYKMELSPEKYYWKKMDQFFPCYDGDPSKERSLNHFLRVTEKMKSLKTACLPRTVRLGETRGGTKSADIIVFDMLAGYNIGFPDDEADRQSLLEAMRTVVSDLHALHVVHMDLYLSNIMWKKLDNGSFHVQLIDFDAAQTLDDRFLTDNVCKRLVEKEIDLFALFGPRPTKAYDTIYLDLYEQNLDDPDLRVVRKGESGSNEDDVKERLDRRCTELKKDFVALKSAGSGKSSTAA